MRDSPGCDAVEHRCAGTQAKIMKLDRRRHVSASLVEYGVHYYSIYKDWSCIDMLSFKNRGQRLPSGIDTDYGSVCEGNSMFAVHDYGLPLICALRDLALITRVRGACVRQELRILVT